MKHDTLYIKRLSQSEPGKVVGAGRAPLRISETVDLLGFSPHSHLLGLQGKGPKK